MHNRGNTASEFTSWAKDRKHAAAYANSRGPGGVVLRDRVSPEGLVASPDRFAETEVLRRGVVTGAEVTNP